jgi:3-oxoadipate enol-lactonase
MKIKANGISMNYEIKGTGKNLVLIHGMGDNLNMWYNQVPVFSKKYRVITYDVRGFGRTEVPPGEITMALRGEDLYSLMKALDIERACFLGFSMGGGIALEFTVAHPEMVEALIMANSTINTGAPTSAAEERGRQMMVAFQQNPPEKAVALTAVGAFSPDFKEKHPKEFERYVKVKQQNCQEGGHLTMGVRSPHTSADVSKVKCPVLFIGGQYDHLGNAEQCRKSVELIPNSKMVILLTGHAAAIEMPATFNAAVMEFLADL